VFLKLNEILSDQTQVVGGVESKSDNMIFRNTAAKKMTVKQRVQQIGFSTAANTGYDLDQAVRLSADQFG